MSDPLRTPEDYELSLYTLAEQFPSVLRSSAFPPEMSFTRLNLPVLIREVEDLIGEKPA